MPAASPRLRHPELVSGSISPWAEVVREAPWMLKQVQHDEGVQHFLGFAASRENHIFEARLRAMGVLDPVRLERSREAGENVSRPRSTGTEVRV